MNVPLKFLSENCWHITLNMNDTFGYATAYGTEVSCEDIPKLLEVYEKFNNDGILAFASIIEEMDVLPPLKTNEFSEALKYLEGYGFWSKMNCYKNYHSSLCECKFERELCGYPIQYKYTGKKSPKGYSIVTAIIETGVQAEGASMHEARENLLRLYKK